MARIPIQVTYGCGCFGTAWAMDYRTRDSERAGARRKLCPSCAEAAWFLPRLQGSRRQVEWAQVIRGRVLRRLAAIAERSSPVWTTTGRAWVIVAFERARRALQEEASASWWIGRVRVRSWTLVVEVEPSLAAVAPADKNA